MKEKHGRRGRQSVPDEDEISGLIGLGMKKEALDAAARILERKNPSPGEVAEAIRAIGVFAPKMARWKPRIEALIARLSKKSRHRMRESFLIYFATIGEHARAAEFIQAPGTLE